jgi:hypothetical protein
VVCMVGDCLAAGKTKRDMNTESVCVVNDRFR